MISLDFEYVRPNSVKEAIALYKTYRENDKSVMYFNGGTEFISRARMDEITPDCVIDIKNIPECTVLEKSDDEIVIGASNTLTDVIESNFYPLLSNVCRSIATRTERNKITIGGNLASNLPYKEAVLPFLLADSELLIATEKGLERKNIQHIFSNENMLRESQFIVQIITNESITQKTFFNEKKTQHSKVNYPVLTLAGLVVDENVRVAFSGLCPFPFRLEEIEQVMNDKKLSLEKRIAKATELLPQQIMDDMHASATYRKFILTSSLTKLMHEVGCI